MSTPYDNTEFTEDPEICKLELRLVAKKEASRMAWIHMALEVEHLAEERQKEERQKEKERKAARKATKEEKKKETQRAKEAKKKKRASEGVLESLAGLLTPKGVPQVVIPVRLVPKKVSIIV